MPSSANNNYYYYNNFIYVALISWAHGALQCKKGENEIIYISQAWNLFTIIILQDLKSYSLQKQWPTL